MKFSIFSCISLLVLLFVLSACSQQADPLIPNVNEDIVNMEIDSTSILVSDYDSSGNPSGGWGLLGLYNFEGDPVTGDIYLTPTRSSLLVDTLEMVDITNFFRLAPCTDCARIESIEMLSDNLLSIDISIKHPFDEGDPFKPITGRNRADLHVFNVEGYVIATQDTETPVTFSGTGQTVGNFYLVNADGYSTYVDLALNTIFSNIASIHPYKLHFKDYSAGNYDPMNPTGFTDVLNPTGNLIMAMGCDPDTQKYMFDLEGLERLDFMFAVGCTYAVSSASKSMRFSPEYRVPQHNKKAASEVWVEIVDNNLADGDITSSATLNINVLDVNHGIPVGDALNEMFADSSVSGVYVEVPGVTSSTISFSTTPVSGSGNDPSDPLIFNGEILNSAGGIEGSYIGLVKIVDSYPPGLNESPLLSGQDGITRVDPLENPLSGLFAIPEFATYQVFKIDVELGNESPVAILNPNPARGCDGATIWFNGSNSYDPDGVIVLYEFDFDLTDGDPSNFNAESSGTESRVQSPMYSAGNYFAALRVTDNLGATDIDVVPVTITPIDGFDISPFSKAYVTDDSFFNIIFTSNGFEPFETQNRQLGLEAMATGLEYIFAVFYAHGDDGNGVYIARSGNNGDSWDDYFFVHEVPSEATFRGAAIAVVDSEVFVAVGEQAPNRLILCHNASNGDGGFDSYLLSNRWSECSISVTVDHADTDNVYVGAAEIDFHKHLIAYSVFVSNTGASGTFTEKNFMTWYYPDPYNHHAQAYTVDVIVSPDRSVYIFVTANYDYEVYRSNDYGANFSVLRQGWDSYPWGRDADIAFDPNNPDVIYWTITYRVGMGSGIDPQIRHAMKRSNNGGSSWSHIHNNLNDSVLGYTNAAITTDRNGNLYLVYGDRTNGNGEIYGKYSTNQGSSFGSSFVISDSPTNNGHVEITTTTDGCDVVVGWLEDRDGTPRVVSHRG